MAQAPRLRRGTQSRLCRRQRRMAERIGLDSPSAIAAGIPLSTRNDLIALCLSNLLRVEPVRFSWHHVPPFLIPLAGHKKWRSVQDSNLWTAITRSRISNPLHYHSANAPQCADVIISDQKQKNQGKFAVKENIFPVRFPVRVAGRFQPYAEYV